MRQHPEAFAQKVTKLILPATSGNASDIALCYRSARGANQLDQLDHITPRLRVLALGADLFLGLALPLGLSIGGGEIMAQGWNTPAVANVLGGALIFSGSKTLYNQALAPKIVDTLADPLTSIIPNPGS